MFSVISVGPERCSLVLLMLVAGIKPSRLFKLILYANVRVGCIEIKATTCPTVRFHTVPRRTNADISLLRIVEGVGGPMMGADPFVYV